MRGARMFPVPRADPRPSRSSRSSHSPGPQAQGALRRRDASGLWHQPLPKQRPRPPLPREGASASPPPAPPPARSSRAADVIAFGAPAWDLDALRGAHGGGRSVWPSRAPLCSRPLRTALSAPPPGPHSQSGDRLRRSPGSCDAADSATCREPPGGAPAHAGLEGREGGPGEDEEAPRRAREKTEMPFP
ncbi:hypothetical protein P7K49_013997 [Saguinus oedipus]|uniref:Uncharacterized protein n=1 Tax=Saguinus oedipus TaxID=9490 RepID=A0ABQ9VKL4_SAGOE|nr:hypothetical protein P7K49_013997 [Saguinus oedipus]